MIVVEQPNSEIDRGTEEAATKSFEDVLIEAGLVTAEQLETVLELQKKTGKKLSEIVIEQGMVGSDEVIMLLSIRLGVPVIDLARHQIEPNAMRLISASTARKYNAIPLDTVAGALVMVMADPEDEEAIKALEEESGMTIVPTIAPLEAIRDAIDGHYKATSEIAEEISHMGLATKVEGGPVSADMLAQTPVVRAVELLLSQAVRDRASDIHMEPQPGRLRVRFRVDGVLHEVMDLPRSIHPLLLSRIKIIADMNIAERRRPQDGQFSATVDGNEVDIRVATTDTTYGEKVVLRVLNKSLTLLTLRDLGFQPDALHRYEGLVRTPYGMVMVGGPTASGKTTTLYASVSMLDKVGANIMTIEDPVEYRFLDITQIGVNRQAGITFPTGLRALIRLNPDIILVGETRDEETAAIGAQAALMGHLMLTSIHANDAVGALYRLLYLGVQPFIVTSALIGAVSQRMVRRICPSCRVVTPLTDAEREAVESELGEVDREFYVGAGCSMCNGTGFRGRVGVFEILVMSEKIGQMVLGGASAPEVRHQAMREGMVPMRTDGMQKARDGITTVREVLAKVG
jgi:general secretion pathway protein E